MYQVSIIGAGNVGRTRCGVIRRCPESQVRVVADVDLQRARKLAETVSADATTDVQAATQDANIDLVVVCTPTKFHAEAAISALRAGKHVLCEKPLARTIAEAEEIVRVAEERNLVLKTGFNYRYMAHVRTAKDIVDSGALGPLYFLRCRYGHGGRPQYEKHWCLDQDLSGGGVLLEQGIHVLDLVRYLLGEPSHVFAQIPRYFWEACNVEDNCFLLLRTESLQTAQIHVSWTQWINIFSLELFGRDGYLHLSGRDGHYGPQRLIWGHRRPDHSRPKEDIIDFSPPDDSWDREWRDFLAAVKSRETPMGSPADSLSALRLVEAAYQSARSQGCVEVLPSAERVESTP